MEVKVKRIKSGVYEVTYKGFRYKTTRKNHEWFVYQVKDGTLRWELVESEFYSKRSAVEYIVEHIEDAEQKLKAESRVKE